MSKLLQLLGQEAYDALKAAMGDSFEAFEQQFENDEITEDDVKAKQTELGLLEKENTNPEVTDPAPESTEPASTDPVETPAVSILSEGWLLENGEVDYDKINDETLRNYIKGLNDRLKQSEWDYKYKMAIMIEAMKSNMYDTSDADKYINMSDLSIDDNGNVIGVKEAFEKLRKEKPHLFKPVGAGSNPLDTGFDPVDKKVTSKPRSYAEAIEQTRALIGN
jgi:hypothetical protein